MRMKLLFTFFIALTAQLVCAQNNVFRQTWNPSGGFTISGDVIHTSDGNLLFSGNTAGNGLAVIKTDMNGNLIWQQNYANTYLMLADQVLESPTGFYILGAVWDTLFNYHYHVTFTDLNGAIQWSRIYSVPANYEIRSNGYLLNSSFGYDDGVKAKRLSDGSIVFLGLIYQIAPFMPYLQVIRIDSTGNLLWKRMIPGDKRRAYDIEIIPPDINCSTDRIYVVLSNNDPLLVALDINGNERWTKSYTWNTFAPNALRYTTDNHFVFAGSAVSTSSSGTYNIGAVKTDTAGNVTWANEFNLDVNEWFNAIACLPGGDIAVCGGINTPALNVASPIMMRLSANGNINWTHSYLIPGHTMGDVASVVSTNAGELVFLGYTTNQPSLYCSYYLVKTNLAGYSGCDDVSLEYTTTPKSVTVSPLPCTINSVLTDSVSTFAPQSPLLTDFMLCSTPIGMKEQPGPETEYFFPNPSSGIIYFKNSSRNTRIIIYNSLGEIVLQETGASEIALHALKPGIYMLQFTTGQSVFTRRLILSGN